MASEILRSPESNRALPSNIQGVATGIAKAAGHQAKEALDHAIQSFNAIREKQTEFAGFDEASIQVAGHAEHPLKYFNHAYATKSLNDDGIVPMNDVFARLRQPNLHYQQGIASFLKSGIQEALAGLKINMDPSVARPVIPTPLDELITPEKLRNPDRKKLQSSVQVINEMFRTLKTVQGDVSDMRLKMLQNIRV
jgi:hypothetical protein